MDGLLIPDVTVSNFYIDRFKQHFQQVAEHALRSGAPVLDVGRGKQFGEDQVDAYGIELPDGVACLTLDVRSEPRPTLVADLSELPLTSNRFSIIFVESVLEHVAPVSKLDSCLNEAHRVLVEQGIIVGWVPFCYHYHGESFPDGNRFTYDGVERLLTDFSEVWIQPCGGPLSVFTESIPKYGDFVRTNGLEEYETKLRYAVFENLLTKYKDRHEEVINSVGFRFFAVK